MKKYYFDVDGVIRDFCKGLGVNNIKTWKLPKESWDKMKNNPKKYLYDCPSFPKIIKDIKRIGLDKVTFLTNQCGKPDREYWTKMFLNRIFFLNINIIFTKNFEEKVDLLKKNKDMILIDDYPYFFEKEGFEEIKDRLYLVKRSYNKHVRSFYKHFYKIGDLL